VPALRPSEYNKRKAVEQRDIYKEQDEKRRLEAEVAELRGMVLAMQAGKK
jgi:hypothetical protein